MKPVKPYISPLDIAIIFLAVIILTLSALAYLYNENITQYNGNNYFPAGTFDMPIIIFFMLLGVRIQFSKHSYICLVITEFLFCYLIIFVIAVATNCVQLTPFTVIDPLLVKLEYLLSVDTAALLKWLSQYPDFRKLLVQTYRSLNTQLMYLPVFLIFILKKDTLREYYFLLLFGVLIGFSLYYFFPSIAPASFIPSPYYVQPQYDTGLKFYQIRYHMMPTTLDGGLIAMPSFHVMWAWTCLYSVRHFPLIWWPLLINNCLLAMATVLLGWHYLSDLFVSLLILLVAHGLLNRLRFQSANFL